MLIYKGENVDVWSPKGKIKLNAKTKQKDLKYLKQLGIKGIEEVGKKGE